MQPHLQELSLQLLDVLPAEHNAVMKKWKDLDTTIKNAGHSQSLLHLKKQYCDQRRCLQCNVGLKILKNV